MTTIQFEINGLTSREQAQRLARSLSRLGDVISAVVRVETGTVTLTGDARTPTAAQAARAHSVVRAAGYEVASDFAAHRSSRRGHWYGRGIPASRPQHA